MSYTYLFHQLATAYNHCWTRGGLASLLIWIHLLQVPWHNDLELPSGFLPHVVDARNPASSGIG